MSKSLGCRKIQSPTTCNELINYISKKHMSTLDSEIQYHSTWGISWGFLKCFDSCEFLCAVSQKIQESHGKLRNNKKITLRFCVFLEDKVGEDLCLAHLHLHSSPNPPRMWLRRCVATQMPRSWPCQNRVCWRRSCAHHVQSRIQRCTPMRDLMEERWNLVVVGMVWWETVLSCIVCMNCCSVGECIQ